MFLLNVLSAAGTNCNVQVCDWGIYIYSITNWGFGSFPFVPPQYVMRPPVTKHVSLHSKLLCKNIARASGGSNNMRPLSRGGGGGGGGLAQTEKIRGF